jgi:hypothetical protein
MARPAKKIINHTYCNLLLDQVVKCSGAHELHITKKYLVACCCLRVRSRLVEVYEGCWVGIHSFSFPSAVASADGGTSRFHNFFDTAKTPRFQVKLARPRQDAPACLAAAAASYSKLAPPHMPLSVSHMHKEAPHYDIWDRRRWCVERENV